ncbi:hypothetical protein EIP91_006105 [Steccherinum ochraceum]|uniref:Uncharacterized protein n=1 Tax=Steccherinum ochraceum TaxID=92696 RepID=A0A4R0RRG4_9APHY|nr:hypothetical protein EIP91_006105 [Steccherinum ochraceum]
MKHNPVGPSALVGLQCGKNTDTLISANTPKGLKNAERLTETEKFYLGQGSTNTSLASLTSAASPRPLPVSSCSVQPRPAGRTFARSSSAVFVFFIVISATLLISNPLVQPQGLSV